MILLFLASFILTIVKLCGVIPGVSWILILLPAVGGLIVSWVLSAIGMGGD